MCFLCEEYEPYLLPVVFFCWLPTQENARSLALHSNFQRVARWFYYSIVAKLLFNFLKHVLHFWVLPTQSPLPHFPLIRSILSTPSLVHLYLFKEPIFHETFPDTPVTTGSSLLWDFWSLIKLLGMISVCDDLMSLIIREGGWDHSSICSFNNFTYPIKISHKVLPRLDIEDTVINKEDSFPDLLKHDWLVEGGGRNNVNYKALT